MIDWKKVTPEKPKEGERVLAYNGIRIIETHWKRGLVHPDVPFPVTHYAAVDLPYKPVALDNTGMEGDRAWHSRKLK